jgi:hypothetical protein
MIVRNEAAVIARRLATEGRYLEFPSKGDRAGSAAGLGLRIEGVGWEPMRRRTILLLLGAGASLLAAGKSFGRGKSSPATLLNAPLEVQANGGSRRVRPRPPSFRVCARYALPESSRSRTSSRVGFESKITPLAAPQYGSIMMRVRLPGSW